MNEENLGTLFSELPKACVVLLEDIDTAGLTHTRQAPHPAVEAPKVTVMPAGAVPGVPTGNLPAGKLSLSALLNILDGMSLTSVPHLEPNSHVDDRCRFTGRSNPNNDDEPHREAR